MANTKTKSPNRTARYTRSGVIDWKAVGTPKTAQEDLKIWNPTNSRTANTLVMLKLRASQGLRRYGKCRTQNGWNRKTVRDSSGRGARKYIGTACTTANSAANKAHGTKLQHYQPLCNDQLDLFFPVAIELFGGVHQTVQKTLEDWAKEVARARGGGQRLINRVLQGWRAHLSVALLKARVDFYSASLLRCLEPGAARRRELYASSYLGDLARLPSAGVRFGSG